ncbi:hypothetical protein ACEPAF_5713 [Sanghuangporus sanghuang]
MRSFSLFALAAAAFAPFVAAAPAPLVDVAVVEATAAKVNARAINADIHARADLPNIPDVPVPVDVDSLLPRGDVRGVAAILVDLKVDVQVQTDALYALTGDDCTSDNLTTILTAIVSIVAGAVVELKALVGADITVILASVDGTAQLAVGVIAQLLADVLVLIFGALGFVLGIVADVQVLLDVIVGVAFGDCICGLISAVLALVDGLLAALIPLVLGLLGTILALGLNIVGELLTIC